MLLQLTHYRILRKLGAGGMGEVYLAQDLKLDRTVALKFLPAEYVSDKDRMKRFLREAKTASAINHPNVAHIYDVGEEQGVSFICMEYVEGKTLGEIIQSEKLDIPQIVEWGTQLTDALDAAHSKGIIHRDLKPSNIMVSPRGQLKLLDFGLAKLASSAPDQDSSLPTKSQTEPGLVLGTLSYMSPEQALGKKIDHRTDIFSLGSVLYQMSAGRPAFAGSTAIEVSDRILHNEPESINRYHHGFPLELERMIRKCMEKDPERRYQSAREVFVDLINFRRDIQSGAGQSQVAISPVKKYPWVKIVATLGVLLAIAVALVFYPWTKREEITSVAILPFLNESGDRNMEYLSDGITESLINNLAQLPKLKVMSRSSVFRYKGERIDPQRVGKDLNVRAVLTGRIIPLGDKLRISLELVDAQDNSQIWGEEYNRTFSDLLSLQQEITSEISNKLRLQLGRGELIQLAKRYTQSNEAYQLYLKGRFYWNNFTEEGLEKALLYFSQAVQKDPQYALAYAGIADAYNAQGFNFFVLPKLVFPKAKTAALKALEIDPRLAEAHVALGVYDVFYEWDWKKAQQEADLAMRLSPKYERSIELNTDNSSHFYCYYLDVIGRPEDSIEAHQQALAIDPFSYFFLAEMSWSYYIARKYDAAIERALNGVKKDPGLVLGYLALANAYRQKGMIGESLAQLNKARTLAPDDPSVLAEVGYGFANAGHIREAGEIIQKLQDEASKRLIDPGAIAIIYVGMGDKQRAFDWLNKAYDARSQWMTWLKMEPKFDQLRSDPRFKVMQARVGLSS